MGSPLFYNQWFGKAIGFTSGFVLAPDNPVALSVLVIGGIACGHLFDMWAARQPPAPRLHTPRMLSGQTATTSEGSADHLRFLFSALGSVARCSGVIQSSQIKSVEHLIRQLDLGKTGRAHAIEWFTEGKENNADFKHLAKINRGQQDARGQIVQLCLQSMCHIAALQPSDAGVQRVIDLSRLLGISDSRVAQSFGAALQRVGPPPKAKPRRKPQSASEPASVQSAYAVLGVSPSASTAQVKKAYRRLVSRHHPDKLGPRASKAAKSNAQERMVELRTALETVLANKQA